MWQSCLVPPSWSSPLGLWCSRQARVCAGNGDSLVPLFAAVLAAADTSSVWQMHSCGCASAKQLSVWEIYQWLSKWLSSWKRRAVSCSRIQLFPYLHIGCCCPRDPTAHPCVAAYFGGPLTLAHVGSWAALERVKSLWVWDFVHWCCCSWEVKKVPLCVSPPSLAAVYP